jgi:hypothetical protein
MTAEIWAPFSMRYDDAAFASIPPYKYFHLSLIEELKTEGR